MGVEKAQGIKKGELKRLGEVRIVSVRRERLSAITTKDVRAGARSIPGFIITEQRKV